MEPEAKRLKHSNIKNEEFEEGELYDSDNENMKSSTPKKTDKSIYLAGIELVCQGPKNNQPQMTNQSKEVIKKESSPTKRKASCPYVLAVMAYHQREQCSVHGIRRAQRRYVCAASVET